MPTLASVARGPSRLRPLLLTALIGSVAPSAPASEAPKVVAVSPADGATEVPVETEIRIRFDRPMDPASSLLRIDPGAPRPMGMLRYDAAVHEFILPVHLTPGTSYDVGLGPQFRGRSVEPRGLRAPAGPSAEAFRWSFRTAAPKPDPAGVEPPRLVSASPPDGADIGFSTLIELVFDRPMDPTAYDLFEPTFDPPRVWPAIVESDYDPAARRFTLLVDLPPDWDGEFRLDGFRSAEGAAAAPIPRTYRVHPEQLSPELAERVAANGRSAKLREVIERAREASLKVESATIRVRRTGQEGGYFGGRPVVYRTCAATFRKAPGGRVAAEVDEASGPPIRLGCDGTNWWAELPEGPVAAPVAAVDSRSVHLADPFAARGELTVDELIRNHRLEYAGEVVLNGRRCHKISSWSPCRLWSSHGTSPRGIRWYIDAETYLPVRTDSHPGYAVDLTIEDVNAPIPDDVFRVPAGTPPSTKPSPLPEGFTKWRVEVCDGANDIMSIGWGMMKGRMAGTSSGVN